MSIIGDVYISGVYYGSCFYGGCLFKGLSKLARVCLKVCRNYWCSYNEEDTPRSGADNVDMNITIIMKEKYKTIPFGNLTDIPSKKVFNCKMSPFAILLMNIKN